MCLPCIWAFRLSPRPGLKRITNQRTKVLTTSIVKLRKEHVRNKYEKQLQVSRGNPLQFGSCIHVHIYIYYTCIHTEVYQLHLKKNMCFLSASVRPVAEACLRFQTCCSSHLGAMKSMFQGNVYRIPPTWLHNMFEPTRTFKSVHTPYSL